MLTSHAISTNNRIIFNQNAPVPSLPYSDANSADAVKWDIAHHCDELIRLIQGRLPASHTKADINISVGHDGEWDIVATASDRKEGNLVFWNYRWLRNEVAA